MSTDRQTIGARRTSAETTSVCIGGKERVLWRPSPRHLSAVDVAGANADSSSLRSDPHQNSRAPFSALTSVRRGRHVQTNPPGGLRGPDVDQTGAHDPLSNLNRSRRSRPNTRDRLVVSPDSARPIKRLALARTRLSNPRDRPPPTPTQVVSTSGDRFAYASTLAVYIFNNEDSRLVKVRPATRVRTPRRRILAPFDNTCS